MQFDLAAAQQHLQEANQHFAGLLPAPPPTAADGATPAPQPEQPQQQPPAAASAHARGYVGAIAGLQQQLDRFAAPLPGDRQQALQQEVAALRQELAAADALLGESTQLVQRWQEKCQQLRGSHEATMTQGLSGPAAS